ncbi:hypothetical protein [Sulfolobus spindle-shaped virus]|nr:hypothetical protein [Sulfolobus spindle-shaped virus]
MLLKKSLEYRYSNKRKVGLKRVSTRTLNLYIVQH